MKSSSSMLISELAEQKRARFALLARVGRQKREASQLQDEATFYSTIVTELLAVSGELLALVESQEATMKREELLAVVDLASRQRRSTRRLLSFWPQNSESQQRFSEMLDSAGVAMVTDTSQEGYVSPSMDQMLKNAERAIVAMKRESNQKQSSSSIIPTTSAKAGTSGDCAVTI